MLGENYVLDVVFAALLFGFAFGLIGYMAGWSKGFHDHANVRATPTEEQER